MTGRRCIIAARTYILLRQAATNPTTPLSTPASADGSGTGEAGLEMLIMKLALKMSFPQSGRHDAQNELSPGPTPSAVQGTDIS